MENVTVEDVILEKKISGYDPNMDNYACEQELTVAITLDEYRKLVKNVATREMAINAAEKDKFTRNAENEALKKQNAELKAELYELQKRLGDMPEADE